MEIGHEIDPEIRNEIHGEFQPQSEGDLAAIQRQSSSIPKAIQGQSRTGIHLPV